MPYLRSKRMDAFPSALDASPVRRDKSPVRLEADHALESHSLPHFEVSDGGVMRT
jgi:hypothetical protein